MNSTLCFVGSTGHFSLVALQTLLEQKITIKQIILAAYAPATPNNKILPVSTPAPPNNILSIQILATQHHIPIHYIADGINDFSSWDNFPHDAPTDYLFVACFPFRLPTVLLHWPIKHAVNLHPSLLPRYRGADPVFWQLQRGETQTGFTLHRLTTALDAGPILFQKEVRFPQGASRHEIDTLLSRLGTQAFCDFLSRPITKATEQDSHSSSYQPPPKISDFSLSTKWSAEQTYNFICGTNMPVDGYLLLLDKQRYHLATALSFDAKQSLDRKIVLHDSEISIQFSPGVLRAKPV